MNKKIKSLSVVLLALVAYTPFSHGENTLKKYENLFTTPLNYVAAYTDKPPVIDGNINDKAWNNAKWTTYFQDIEGNLKPNPRYKTRVKMLWDNKYIYVAAELEEPNIWGNLTKRDEIVYLDNDFEMFINPENTTHNYFEIEINALNDIFDLFITQPYRNSGYPLHSWNALGMKHAVNIQGSLNVANDVDKSWTVELAVPYTSMAKGTSVNVPKNGDIWRLNFSRVEWNVNIVNGKYVKKKDQNGKALPENNWVWSPQGVINMHYPERWGYIQFSTQRDKNTLPKFIMPYIEKQKKHLWLIYYKQQDFKAKNKRYAASLEELGFKRNKAIIEGKSNTIKMYATAYQFTVTINDNQNNKVSLNETGLISKD